MNARLSVLILTGMCLILAGCNEALPLESSIEESGGISKIVFISYEENTTLLETLPTEQIYIMDHNGENKKCLTHDKGHLYPQFLPDGSRIVFQSIRGHLSRDHLWEIYIMDVDGSNQTNLTKGLGGTVPLVSPDGSKVLFSAYRPPDSSGIYIMDVDGDNQTRLTNIPGLGLYPLEISRDGSKILFWGEDYNDREVYIVDIDGGDPTQLTDAPGKADLARFSPDGSKVVFVAEGIYVINIDGSNPTALTSEPGYYYSPSFSPDGSKILFGARIKGNSSIYSEIYTMDADGRNLIRLTNNLKWDCPVQFSPDGSQILFMSDIDGNNEIYLMSADGKNQKNLTNRPEIDESPQIYPLF